MGNKLPDLILEMWATKILILEQMDPLEGQIQEIEGLTLEVIS